LAAVFTFLSLDEMLMFHDRLSAPLRALGASGAFFFAWVIPYGIAVVLLGLMYLRFFLSLTPRTRIMMFVAAGCFLGGSIGLEMISAVNYEDVQARTLLLDFYNLIEETLEMVGVLIFIRILTEELTKRQLSIRFSEAEVSMSQGDRITREAES
jgi:hypothetical protein